MRTLKRLSAIVISLFMIMSCMFTTSVFAAEMNDVKEGDAYYKAIMDLVDKGVITGYANDDGTYSFKSEGEITRAEFCALIARADAPTGYVFTSTTSSFPDISADYWATPYIEYAVTRKIVNGMGDGTFSPELPVTYAQAVKMIVCALNYGFAAETTEPWYQTYIDLGNRLGVTKAAYGNPDSPAVRGLIAQLVYNMNDTAPAVQTGVDANGKPVYEMGDTKFEEQTKGTQEVTGQVISVFDNTISNDTVANNQIKVINGSKSYVFNKGAYSMDDLEDFLGYQVDISYSEDNSGASVLERITKTKRNKELVVTDQVIDASSVSSAGLEYIDDSSSKGVSEIKFATDMKVVLNGTPKASGWVTDMQNLDSGSIKFIDCDSNSTMDVAFISSYQTIYVKSAVNNNNIYDITNSYATPAQVQFNSNRDYIVKVANNGSDTLASGTLSSIAKTNIVSYVNENDDESEIIVSKKTATGKVSFINNDKKTVTVGGKDYKYSNLYLARKLASDAAFVDLNIDDNCTLYLDYTGKIAAVSKTETQASYGYITNIAAKSGMNSEIQVKIFTDSGFKTYTVADNVRFNSTSISDEDLVGRITTAAGSVASAPGRGISDTAFSASSESSKAVLVKYEVSNNKLSSVNTLSVLVGGSSTYEANKFSGGSNAINIDGTTKVFFVPNVRTDETKYKFTTGSSGLTKKDPYYVDAFDIVNGTAKAVVVYGNTVYIKPSDETIYVRKIDTKLNNGETVQELKYDTLSTLKSAEDDAKTILTKELNTLSGVEPGDIIKILKDGNTVERYMMIFDSSAQTINVGTDYIRYSRDGSNNITDDYTDAPGKVVYMTSASNTDGYFATYGTVTVSPALVGTEEVDATTMAIEYNSAYTGGVKTVEYVSIVKDDMIFKYDPTGGTVGSNSSDYYFTKGTRDNVPQGAKVLVISTSKAGGIQAVIVYP